jgi:hypothetical protein
MEESQLKEMQEEQENDQSGDKILRKCLKEYVVELEKLRLKAEHQKQVEFEKLKSQIAEEL